MIFHENRLLADDSHEISCLTFFRKLGKMSQNVSSAAVVISTLRVKSCYSYVSYVKDLYRLEQCILLLVEFLKHLITWANGRKFLIIPLFEQPIHESNT